MRPYPQTNPLSIAGFFPKASTTTSRFYYGNNAGAMFDKELHKWMSYKDLIKRPNPKICAQWNKSGINEFARLAQGLRDTEGMDVVSFIQWNQVPGEKKVTYARYVVDYRPEKDEPWRLCITCGGNRL